MQYRIASVLVLALIVWYVPASAQRPRVGFGLGAGAVLGSQLVDFDFLAPIDGSPVRFTREVNLEDVAVVSAHGEWYVTPHIALRAHSALGGGRLQIQTVEKTDGIVRSADINSDFGDVRVSALDGGISLWPLAPSTVGFAPFLTIGYGRITYDFDAGTGDGLFHADGRRTEKGWAVGIGADMNVWKSISLRIEGIDHVVDSPLRRSDFDAALDPDGVANLRETVNNVRMVVGLNIYLPFRSPSLPSEH